MLRARGVPTLSITVFFRLRKCANIMCFNCWIFPFRIGSGIPMSTQYGSLNINFTQILNLINSLKYQFTNMVHSISIHSNMDHSVISISLLISLKYSIHSNINIHQTSNIHPIFITQMCFCQDAKIPPVLRSPQP